MTQNKQEMQCEHKFEIIETREGTEKLFFSRRVEQRKVYVLQYDKCGLIKQRWAAFPGDAKIVGGRANE